MITIDEIQKLKSAISFEISKLDGFRQYEDHLLQGIQINRINIREKEAEVYQMQSQLVTLCDKYVEEQKSIADLLKFK